jgi:PKHD-type hydroxylase
VPRHFKPEILDYLQKEKQHGQTIWPFHTDKIEPWAFMNDTFTPAQCKTIIEIGKNQILDVAITGGFGNQVQDDKVRKSRTSWISPANGNEWIFQRMTDVVMHLNEQFFKFDLWGFGEGFQFTEYQAPGGHYKPHIDCMYNGRIRKLSVVCQLTDPNEYEGGELVVNNGNEVVLPKDQGTVLVFPSYSLHGVKPVISGTRYSLVAWLTGPAFK